MDKFLIKYHKWTKDDSKHFHRSCRETHCLYEPPNSITQSIHFIFIITIHGILNIESILKENII